KFQDESDGRHRDCRTAFHASARGSPGLLVGTRKRQRPEEPASVAHYDPVTLAASALENRQRLVDEIAVILGNLPGRRHLVDDLRQHLRNTFGRLFLRHAELLRDLTELSLSENLLENARIDRQIGTRAYPRL